MEAYSISDFVTVWGLGCGFGLACGVMAYFISALVEIVKRLTR